MENEPATFLEKLLKFVSKNIILEILVAVIAGLIVAYIVQEGRFAPSTINPASQNLPTDPVPTKEIIETTSVVNSTPVNSADVVSPIPVGKLQFSEDFEDGFSNGITFNSGDWKVIDDGTGNKVLMNSSNGDAVIGPPYTSNFSDGVLEFRFKTANNMQVAFRLVSTSNGYTSYPLFYDFNSFQLHYQKNGGTWQPVEGTSINGTNQLFNNEWITVRVETQGANINIYANSTLVIAAYDSRISEGRIDFGGTDVQFDDFKIWDISQ